MKEYLESLPHKTLSIAILGVGIVVLVVNSYMFCSGGFGTGIRLFNAFYCSSFGSYLSSVVDNPSVLWHWNSNLTGWIGIAITAYGVIRLVRGEPPSREEVE